MSPTQKKTTELTATWIYRSIIGGMTTLLLIWFNDFRNEYHDLQIDHRQLKSDFYSHKETQKGELNLINANIKTLARNQSMLFKNFTDPEVEWNTWLLFGLCSGLFAFTFTLTEKKMKKMIIITNDK